MSSVGLELGLSAGGDGDLCGLGAAAGVLPDLLDQIEAPIRRFTVDEVHDHRSICDRVGAAGAEDVMISHEPSAALLAQYGVARLVTAVF